MFFLRNLRFLNIRWFVSSLTRLLDFGEKFLFFLRFRYHHISIFRCVSNRVGKSWKDWRKFSKVAKRFARQQFNRINKMVINGEEGGWIDRFNALKPLWHEKNILTKLEPPPFRCPSAQYPFELPLIVSPKGVVYDCVICRMVEFTRMLSGLLVVKSKSTFILPYTKKKKKKRDNLESWEPVPTQREPVLHRRIS